MRAYGHRQRPPVEGETIAGVESRITAPLDKLEPLLPDRIKSIHIDELTSGIIRSEDSEFIIDLDDKTITITDEEGTVRVVMGDFGADSTDYGIKVWDENGALALELAGAVIKFYGDLEANDGTLGTITAGVLRDAASDFVINLASKTVLMDGDGSITVKDGGGVTRVVAGNVGSGVMGIRVFNSSGLETLDGTGSALGATLGITSPNVIASADELLLRSLAGNGINLYEANDLVASFGYSSTSILGDGVIQVTVPSIVLECSTNFRVFDGNGGGQGSLLTEVDGGTINSGDATTDDVISTLRDAVTAMSIKLTSFGFFANS